MGLSSASIAAKTSLLLVDETGIRWSVPEMCKWINAATNELVMLKPTALTANVAVELRPGTKQNLVGATFKDTQSGVSTTIKPIQLLDVSRNLGASGLEDDAGRAVTGIARDILDTTLPGWHTVIAGEVQHYAFDPKDPKRFYVYPGTAGNWHVEVIVSRSPVNALGDDDATYGTNDIDPEIDDIYEGALVDYCMYRAYLKDSEHTSNAQRAQWHYEAFRSALGGKVRSEFTLRPQEKFDSTTTRSRQPTQQES